MKKSIFFQRILPCFFSVLTMLFIFPKTEEIHAAAAEKITWDLFSDHTGEAGMYLYTISGRLNDPANPSDYNSKSDLIDTLYFDFSLIDHNGTGSMHTYRADFSVNSSMKQSYPNFIPNNFVASEAKDFSFQVWLPGQLIALDFLLNLNGYLGWFSYERLNFEINSITCNGIPVNTNPSSDYVSSATSDSKGHIGVRMSPVDGNNLMDAMGLEHVTISEYKELIASEEFDNKILKDAYNAVLDKETFEQLPTLCDGAINQSFSHADEASWYYYTINFEVNNPINVNDAAPDALNTLYFDFDYKEDNGYGNTKTYRYDLSWSKEKQRNLNDTCANLFRSINDDSYDIQIGLWVPGIVSQVKVKLNMDGGERLGFTIHSVNLGGFRISNQTDYVTSSYYDSSAVIPCSVPEAQISLNSYTDDEVAVILKQIKSNQRMNLQDQYGSYITDILWNKANQEIRDYFNTFTDRATPLQLTRSSKYIMRNAMHETLYHAQINETIQEYMAGRKAAVEGASSIAQRLMEESGEYIPPIALPANWTYKNTTSIRYGTIVFSGLPKEAQIYRKLIQYEGTKAIYIHLKPEQMENHTFEHSGFVDEFYISVPENFSIAGIPKISETQSLSGITLQCLNEETGVIENEKYYMTDKEGNIVTNNKGVPRTDNSKKPKSFSYQYKLEFSKDGTTQYICPAASLPENGISDTAHGNVRFENLPAEANAYRKMITSDGGVYILYYTNEDLMNAPLTLAAEIHNSSVLSDMLYLSIPEKYYLLNGNRLPAMETLSFEENSVYYHYQGDTLESFEKPETLTFDYQYSISLEDAKNKTFTTTSQITSQKKNIADYHFINQYTAEKRTVLYSGYDIRFISYEKENTPLVYVDSAVKTDTGEASPEHENDAEAILYIFFPDTGEYAIYDDNNKPLSFKSIDTKLYAVFDVDMKKYSGYYISLSNLKKSIPTNQLYAVKIGD